MSDEWIESKIPDLEGMTLEEIRNDPRLREVAARLIEELSSYPDDGVIVCCDPPEVELPGSRRTRRSKKR